MTTRAEILTEAREWIGTPWIHQAYRKAIGCDCIGFVAGVALMLGLPEAMEWRDTPEYHSYARQPNPRLLLAGCELFLDRLEEAQAKTGDILVMRFRHEPMHFAIISRDSPRYVIHALERIGHVVEHRFDELLNGRVMRAYRYRGVDGEWEALDYNLLQALRVPLSEA